MKRLLLLLALLAAPLRAGEISFEVRDKAGKPVASAVVTLHVDAGTPAPRPAGSYQVVQKDIQFDPFVLVVPVGANVSFPNRDDVRHQVYSFSETKTFELKLYARDQTHVVHFDKPGIVPLGCNIHDKMTAFVNVVDTPWAAKTGIDGRVRFANAPQGAVTARIWHPYARVPAQTVTLKLPAAIGVQRVTLPLRTPPMADTY